MKCAYCQSESPELHKDHVVPRSRGGPDNAFNIVMACQPCNAAKRDSLASEWLGDRCPASVLLIEAKVNAKLKTIFKKRDYRKPDQTPSSAIPEKPKLFAYSLNSQGGACFIGEVINEFDVTIRMEVVDAVMATGGGMWQLSGQIEDVPRENCKLFSDHMACLESALMRNNELYRTQKSQ